MTERTSACRHGQTGECAACSDERYDELARLRAERDAARALLREAHTLIDNECCPSQWRTADGRPHIDLCKRINALLVAQEGGR